jgi:hypothetical protein
MSTARHVLLSQLQSAVRKLKALEDEELQLRAAIDSPRRGAGTARKRATGCFSPVMVHVRAWRRVQIH